MPSQAGLEMLDALGREYARLGPPVIIFNKSHSGSRLLAQLLIDHGVFFGARMNDSNDSLPVLDVVKTIVERHIPDYAVLFRDGDPELAGVFRAKLAEHLEGFQPPGRWGWKLCETVYILPVLARIFPNAMFIHLIRDGLDVAFADHVAPKEPFWQKVYFHTDQIDRWIGLPLTARAYRNNSHIFNSRHWAMSVSLGRAYGAMLGERYIEVRYEDLIQKFPETAQMLCEWLGVPYDAGKITALQPSVHSASLGKWRRQPAWKVQEAISVLEPTLTEFGYSVERGSGPMPRRSWAQRTLWSRFPYIRLPVRTR